MAATERQPGSVMTRREFLAAACVGAVALAIWRRSAGTGTPATAGTLRPKRADNLLEDPHGAGLHLRPTPVDDQGPTFRLNGPGAFVWRRIDGKRSVDALAAQLGAAYGLPSVAAQADTLALLASMMRIGLVFDPAG